MPRLPHPDSRSVGPRRRHHPLAAALAIIALALPGLASAASTIDPSSFSTITSTVWQFIVAHSARTQAPTCYSSSAQRSESYNCLLVILEGTGLDTMLKDAGPITLFAPTDAGFAQLARLLGARTFTQLMTQPDKLKLVMQNLMVQGRYTSADLKARSIPATGRLSLQTLAGTELELTFGIFPSPSGRVTVEIGNVAQPAWKTYLSGSTTLLNNGSVIPIDMVVLPPGVDY